MKRNLTLILGILVITIIILSYVAASNLGSQNTPTPSTSPTTTATNSNTTPTPTSTTSLNPNPSTSATSPTPPTTPTTNPTASPSANPTSTATPSPTANPTNTPSSTPNISPSPSSNVGAPEENKADHEETADYVWTSSDVVNIVLNGNSIMVSPATGTIVDGSKVTINSAGTYKISGSLTDGQIIVDTEDKETVRLILSNTNIICSNSAPISVLDAKKVILVLEENTRNYLTDGITYVFTNSEEDEPNAAIFSKADLTIFGNGALEVTANYNDAIASKDGLIIKSGSITINAIDDGIRGKDYLIIKEGTLTITSGGDGLKSDNDADATAGYILIESGKINIISNGDAIDASTDVIISGGEFTLTSGGGSEKVVAADTSSKGIKGDVSVIINAGSFTINSADDAVHSNGKVTINAGSFNISTGDDAFHADLSLTVNGGDIKIIKSFEGLESAVLTINNGNIRIISSDDGLNCAGGNDGSSTDWMPLPGAMPGIGGFPSMGNYNLTITGGYIYIDAYGDGVDINGKIVMTGGTLIINGPIQNMNGAIDYDSSFQLTGGTLIAVGSSGMAMAPSPTSSQNSVLVVFNRAQSANTLINIQAASGDEIVTFKATKAYQSIVVSSAELIYGSYNVYLGGSSTGTLSDSVFENGVYTGGTQYRSFTISGILTNVR